MKKSKILLLTLTSLFVASCVHDSVDVTGDANEVVAESKIINTSESAIAGELIIYVDEESASMLEGAKVATRSGVTSLDMLAEELGATDIAPVFNMSINAELKRELNMHRWYTVKFPADRDLEMAAKSLSAIKEIERVQFSTRAVIPQEKMIPVNIADFAQTRSEELPFDDPNLAQQWHYNNDGTVDFPNAKAGADINLFSAWKHTAGRNDVIVAVVDEGVCYTHEDLAANMWVNKGEVADNGIDDDGNGYIDDIHGYNFADGGKITWNKAKDSGHGTHVAGTVAAVNNNGIGVCGVAGGTGKGDGVRIMSCQIMSNGDSASPATTAKAVEYAADKGACVLQNSWGFKAGAIGNDYMFETGQTSVEKKAFEYFMKKKNCEALDGGIVIFAAGNDTKSVAGYPAAWNKLIAVTAIAPDGLPTHYTCYDRGCNVAAPGGEYGPQVSTPGCVLSTIPPDVSGAKGAKYGLYQGTSMACPHVSGIAALAISYALDNGIKMSLPELKDIIVSSVRNLNDFMDTNFKTNYDPYSTGSQINLASYKNKMGTGLIDAERVLMAVRGTTCIPVPVGEQFTLDISKYIGDGKGSIKMLQTQIPNDVIETLGIEGLKFTAGKYMMTCTKPGTALVKLKYVAGGTVVGGGQIVGGMETEQEFAIIARPGYTIDQGTLTPNNPGGWL